jgi:hypothetical protein
VGLEMLGGGDSERMFVRRLLTVIRRSALAASGRNRLQKGHWRAPRFARCWPAQGQRAEWAAVVWYG